MLLSVLCDGGLEQAGLSLLALLYPSPSLGSLDLILSLGRGWLIKSLWPVCVEFLAVKKVEWTLHVELLVNPLPPSLLSDGVSLCWERI